MRTAFVLLVTVLTFGFFVCLTNGQSRQIITNVFESEQLSNQSLMAFKTFPISVGTFKAEFVLTTDSTFSPPFHLCIQANYKVSSNDSDWSNTSCTVYKVFQPNLVPAAPTTAPTAPPTTVPTAAPTSAPTPTPTNPPTISPTSAPTTESPTTARHPTTSHPTSELPTTSRPTQSRPTTQPTESPTLLKPTTAFPTIPPSTMPTAPPSVPPTVPLTERPTTMTPTTERPTTMRPTPERPTTMTPTIERPTTMTPTTERPTAGRPTAGRLSSLMTSTDERYSKRAEFALEEPSEQKTFYYYYSFDLNLPYTGPNSNYSIVVFYYNHTRASNNAKSMVTLSLSTDSCASDNIVPPLCVEEIELGHNTNIPVSPSGTYLRATVSPFSPRLALNITSTQPLEIYASLGIIPTPETAQYHNTSKEFIVETPSPGVWHFFVTSSVAETVTVNFDNTSCNPVNEMFGPNCDILVILPNDTSSGIPFIIEIQSNKTGYLRTYVRPGTPLDLYVALLPQGAYAPEVYVREGNLPEIKVSEDNDANGCTFDASRCFATRILLEPLHNSTEEKVYFVAINNRNKTSKFAMWTNAPCAYNCTDKHYHCSQQIFGQCNCGVDASRLNFYCGPLKPDLPLSARLIILVTMGALILVSGIIGFLAWIYMRQKKIRYEKV